MSISTQPPSGMRDFLPAEVRRREYVVARIRDAYERHGFAPLETPAMERVEVLTGKYGDEGEQLMFRVLKRGEKLPDLQPGVRPADLVDFALRYDLTVPLARVVAQYANELPRLFRRYQIQPVWRADRPQRGRFREFYQCDVDFVGTTSLMAEVSVIGAVREAMGALGFADFVIRVNDRRVLAGFMELAGVGPGEQGGVFTAIDKLDKIGADGVRRELAERGIGADGIAALDPLLEAGNDDAAATLDGLGARFAGRSSTGADGVASLRALLALLEAEGITLGALRVDPSLARGLSYYTGTIFEVALAGMASSVGGGGRYDGLVGMFRGTPVPAVGFSLGLERLLVLLDERGMLPALPSGATAMVAPLDDAGRAAGLRFARDARAAGVAVEVFPEDARLGKQLKHAESVGIGHVVLIGSREADAGIVLLKDLATGEQAELEPGEAVARLRELTAR